MSKNNTVVAETRSCTRVTRPLPRYRKPHALESYPPDLYQETQGVPRPSRVPSTDNLVWPRCLLVRMGRPQKSAVASRNNGARATNKGMTKNVKKELFGGYSPRGSYVIKTVGNS